MILPDVNVLVHAHNSDSRCHEAARNWWGGSLAGSGGIGLAWAVLLGSRRSSNGTAGNLTTDAHLAVLAMERGYVLYSTDTDFALFAGLRWEDPCKR